MLRSLAVLLVFGTLAVAVPLPKATFKKLATQVAGKSVATESIRTGKDGIFRTHINDNKIDQPVQLLKFDKEDEEWELKSKIKGLDFFSIAKHLGEEKIQVTAGTYTAVKIHITSEIAKTKTEVSYWLVEDVGITQLEYKIAGNESPPLKLKSFAPGKEK